jgi:intein/homing endonuclease
MGFGDLPVFITVINDDVGDGCGFIELQEDEGDINISFELEEKDIFCFVHELKLINIEKVFNLLCRINKPRINKNQNPKKQKRVYIKMP